MKKILFILTILSIFILSSCNKKNNTNDESSNSDSTTEVDNQNDNENQPEEDGESVYDDGETWGTLHE